MDKITKVSTLTDPKFVKPVALEYSQNGEIKRWEAVISHDSVAILLWHKERDSFVLVKQLRPAVLNANPTNGYMYELCAGIVDKESSLVQIAKEEILEECGYDVPLQSIQRLSSFYTSVGIAGSHQTLYYAEINETMLRNNGGGLIEEDIEVIYLQVSKAREFMFDESYQKTPGMLMAFYWFFDNK
jgi:UDP-sugar diphosphatase